jgi:hypothetical protein
MSVEMGNYTRTERALPPRGVPIEWIAPSGERVEGKFLGGMIWMPFGSGLYGYYTPPFWRLLPPRTC